jgi:hypothetical protein
MASKNTDAGGIGTCFHLTEGQFYGLKLKSTGVKHGDYEVHHSPVTGKNYIFNEIPESPIFVVRIIENGKKMP